MNQMSFNVNKTLILNQVRRDDKIFQSEKFKKESVLLNIMVGIIEDEILYPTPKVFSDGKDCIIVNSDPEHSVIVWTSNDYSEYKKLFNFIQKEFSNNLSLRMMSKIDLYDFLKNNKKVSDERMVLLGVYQCTKLNDIKYIGRPDNIKEDEISEVAKLRTLYCKETGEDINITPENCMEYAKNFIDVPCCKVWRNDQGKIVAIASIQSVKTYSRIGGVVTLPEERGKSYAKMLVHFLTSEILSKGETPVLYTDYNYSFSNKCYIAVGYEFKGNSANYGILRNPF